MRFILLEESRNKLQNLVLFKDLLNFCDFQPLAF